MTYALITGTNGGQIPPPYSGGLVIANGPESSVIQVPDGTDLSRYAHETLTEADAQFWALELSPGTLMPADVDDLDAEIQDRYGRSLADWTTQEGVNLETYLSEYTERWPAGHPQRKEPQRL